MNFNNKLNEKLEAYAGGCTTAEQSVLQWL
jgi:hypothetical protein